MKRNILIFVGLMITLIVLIFFGKSIFDAIFNFTTSFFFDYGWLTIVGFIGAVALMILSFVWFAHEAAKGEKGSWTATVPLEEFKFVVAGESLHKILPNLKGAGLDEDGNVTEKKDEQIPIYRNPLFNILVTTLGIYWVSILYPLRQIHGFKIDKYRLMQESTLPKDHSLRELVQVEKGVTVYSLRRFIPRPLYIPEVEFKDGFTVRIVVMSEWEVTNPRKPVFNYDGKFFPLLDAGVEGSVNDYGNDKDYMELIKAPTGRDSEFSKYIVDQIADKLEETVGIRLRFCYIVQMDLSEGQQKAKEATQAAEIAKLEALAIRTTAEADAYRIEKLAEASSKTFALPVQALKAEGVDVNIAASVVGRTNALDKVGGKDSKIVTFVEGGSQTAVTIPTSTKGE